MSCGRIVSEPDEFSADRALPAALVVQKIGLVHVLAAAIGASAAYADSECVKGYRDTTAAERQTMLAVMV